MRGVPQIKEELKENFQEVREEVQHTIKEVREEIRKGPLVDVSGLVNLINNLFGRGPSHEVTDEVTGTWAEGVRPKLELRTRNGSVTVTGWNEPHYKVIVRKWVHAAGEEEAKRLAADAVHVPPGTTGSRWSPGITSGSASPSRPRSPRTGCTNSWPAAPTARWSWRS